MPDQTPATTAETEEPAVTVDDNGPALGQGGRNAVAAERDARKAAEKKIRELETQVATLAAEKIRGEIATAKGVPVELLSGDTREDLEAHADRLLAFRGDKPAPSSERRPRESLRPGASNEAEAEATNTRALAARIFENG